VNNAQTIPTDDATGGVITFTLLSDGNAVPETTEILSIQVSKTANRIPFARINVRDGDAGSGTFEVSSSDLFTPGREIEIRIGHDGDNTKVFLGVAVRQRVRVRPSGESFLEVECRDKAFAMALGRKNRYFTDVTDADALGEIIGEYGLEADVEDSGVTHRELLQFHGCDWDFMVTRAEANGRLVIVDDGKITIKTPEISGDPVLQLAYGGNLLAFDAELDARYQWKKVTANAWDSEGQTLFEATSEDAGFTENGNLSGATLAEVSGLDSYDLRHGGFLAEDELQRWADAALLKSRLSRIRGTARYIGPFIVRVGEAVELQGVGERFNGLVYVTGVNYALKDGACFVDLQFGLSPEWFQEKFEVSTPAAGGLLPAVAGLQIGKVKQLEGDPDGADRILVTLPLLDGAGDGSWARLATLDAGSDRGWVVRPEIDDEVIIGFLNDDPREAIVIGQLHGAGKPAPIPATDDNHLKGYTSRSGMHLSFDDDQKIITIDTPAGNKLVLSEADTAITMEDQNGNAIVLNADGIKITSAKDIVIEAPSGKIDVTAGQDLAAAGLNVNVSASAQLKAEGSAAAELSSGGSTTVKGAMLMLN